MARRRALARLRTRARPQWSRLRATRQSARVIVDTNVAELLRTPFRPRSRHEPAGRLQKTLWHVRRTGGSAQILQDAIRLAAPRGRSAPTSAQARVIGAQPTCGGSHRQTGEYAPAMNRVGGALSVITSATPGDPRSARVRGRTRFSEDLNAGQVYDSVRWSTPLAAPRSEVARFSARRCWGCRGGGGLRRACRGGRP